MEETVYLLLNEGVPSYTAWGTSAEDALDRAGKPSPQWSAVETAWRRSPAIIYGGCPRNLKVNRPRLEGRDLVVGGCRVSLDDPGRPKIKPEMAGALVAAVAAGDPAVIALVEKAAIDTEQEPYAPDMTVEDEAALLATVEELGHPVQFTEKHTLKHRRVKPKLPPRPRPE